MIHGIQVRADKPKQGKGETQGHTSDFTDGSQCASPTGQVSDVDRILTPYDLQLMTSCGSARDNNLELKTTLQKKSSLKIQRTQHRYRQQMDQLND